MGDKNVSRSVSTERIRNMNFSWEETEALLKIVDEYKAIILNKSTVSAVNFAKDAAWIKIAEAYNSQGFKNTRQPECLKTRWLNLKRDARRALNNLSEHKYEEFSGIMNKVLALMNEAEVYSSIKDVPKCIREDLKVMDGNSQEERSDKNGSNLETDESDGEIDERSPTSVELSGLQIPIKQRSINFSPQETRILLKCIREEKRILFSKECTKKANALKKRAWSRITQAFNKRSPIKRQTVALQNKFTNIKKRVSLKRAQQQFETSIDVKIEPNMENMEPEDNHSDEDSYLLADSNTKRIPGTIEDPLDHLFDGDLNNCYNRKRRNFSPRELKILLKCVREERNYLYPKNNASQSYQLRSRAWSRITSTFNKSTLMKRSPSELQAKIGDIRKFKRNFFENFLRGKQHNILTEDDSKEDMEEASAIQYEESLHSEQEQEGGACEEDECAADALPDSASNGAPDPLAAVLGSDSGLGSTSFIGAYNFGNNEVSKLKVELLKYKLENEKLERQRITEALKEQSEARHAAAIERALRLRAARLEAAAAAARLPAAHPALRYTAEEARAQEYAMQL